MARAGIRYEDVEQAAEAMARAHINPTHERIRAALGGGSFSTIGRHLQTWRQSLAEEGAEPAEAVPPDSLVDAVKGVWQGMRGAAEARVADVEALAQTAIQEAQTEAHAQIEALTVAHDVALRDLEADAQARITAAHNDAMMARQRAEDLVAQHTQERAAHEALAGAHTIALVQAAEAQGRADALAERCQSFERQAQRDQTAHREAIRALEQRFDDQAAQTHAVHSQVVTELAAQRDSLAAAHTQSLAAAAAQLAAQEAQTATWQASAEQTQAHLVQLEAHHSRMQSDLNAARAQCQAAEDQAQAHKEQAQKHETALYTLRGETQGRVHVIEELREAFNALAGEQLVQRHKNESRD